MKQLSVLLLTVGLVLIASSAFAQGPAGDPRDNLNHPGTPTDRYVDAGELRDVLHLANDDFYGCYREHVRGTKEAGEVAVRFTVNRDGVVVDAAAELDRAPPELGPCLEDVLRALEFRGHDGDPVVVSYPLVYQVDRKGARILPYPVVFTKPRPVRLPLLLLPVNIAPGELRMLERVLVDPDERVEGDVQGKEGGGGAGGSDAPTPADAAPPETSDEATKPPPQR
ncbi:MAG: hypothetical protein KDA24_14055 [Deltaproteobacteria bacterium]|nr:hypothetical protein [Deltaproteobacteria bacterium]